MSREAVNFVLDKYSVDSGVFKIYYDYMAGFLSKEWEHVVKNVFEKLLSKI